MNALQDFFVALLGLGAEPKHLTFVQCSVRGIVMLLCAIVMLRLGSRRALAEKTVLDTVFIVILGAVLSRAINGPSPFFETIGLGFVLVFFHRLLAAAAYRSHAFGKCMKGTSDVIVRDGKSDERVMAQNNISQHDLEEDLRLDAKAEDLSRIKIARLERSGDISFIKKEE